MREIGQLIRKERDTAVIRLTARDGCDKCGLSGHCQAAGKGARELRLPIRGTDLKPGEQVEIETAPGGVITAAFLVFILPLILSIAAYTLVSKGLSGEGMAVLAFLATFGLSEFLIMGIDRLFGRKSLFKPRIVRRISSEQDESSHGRIA